VLWEFEDVFLEEVPRFPPKRDMYFSIDLVPEAMPISKVPYIMITPKLVDLKVQLKEMLDKGYIKLSVSPLEAPVVVPLLSPK